MKRVILNNLSMNSEHTLANLIRMSKLPIWYECYDKFRRSKKHRRTYNKQTDYYYHYAIEVVNKFYVELFFFLLLLLLLLFSLVFFIEPNHMHAAQLHLFTFSLICALTHTHTSMPCGSSMNVCVCIICGFSVQNYCFIQQTTEIYSPL